MKDPAKIYCAGPIRGDVFHVEYYYQIVALVWQLGHLPLTELALSESESEAAGDSDIYLRDMRWLEDADALIAEVSGPSLGVGYEVSYALHNLNIPVLCVRIRSAKPLSAMIAGNDCDRMMVKTYDSGEELERIVKEFLEQVSSFIKGEALVTVRNDVSIMATAISSLQNGQGPNNGATPEEPGEASMGMAG